MGDDSEPPEHDHEPAGPGLFGDAAPAASNAPSGYLVLARKYRPQRFEDLIGQEAMVRTIANAFALSRIPHAYMLTGVRGVGKTTTARLIARGLNYDSEARAGPTTTLDPPGRHCARIMASNHSDVMEMDAASRTGINDIREILDSVRYAPVEARRKVYIIDEVHMLSTQAFNGLLKTLEEPPAHVTFIFATTEIRKVPVTVLSRCQRFDLRRVPQARLETHLAMICEKEGVRVAAEGLSLIARAAEGSVRDALSLLDQALVQQGAAGSEIGAGDIAAMLGLADRARMRAVFAAVLAGAAGAALSEARAQYNAGADPALMLRDLMDLAHDAARAQAMGAAALLGGDATYAQAIAELAAAASPAQLSRLWQMLLKAADETARAPEPIAALEMALIRLCAAQRLPPPEDAAALIAQRRDAPDPAPPPTRGPSPDRRGPQSFDEVVALIAEKRDVGLEIDVERSVRLSAFAPGLIRYAPAEGAPADLPQRLARALKTWTGQDWEVRADGVAAVESLRERREREAAQKLAAIKAHPFVADALRAFPGAEIEAIIEPGEAEAERGAVLEFPGARRREQG